MSFDKLPIHGGTKSPGSVVRVDNMIIFLAHDAILGLTVGSNGYLTIVNLSVNIENTLLSLVNKENIVATYYRGNYLLSCCDDPDLGYNNLIIRGYTSFPYSTLEDKSGETKTIRWTTIRGWHVESWLRDLNEHL